MRNPIWFYRSSELPAETAIDHFCVYQEMQPFSLHLIQRVVWLFYASFQWSPSRPISFPLLIRDAYSENIRTNRCLPHPEDQIFRPLPLFLLSQCFIRTHFQSKPWLATPFGYYPCAVFDLLLTFLIGNPLPGIRDVCPPDHLHL